MANILFLPHRLPYPPDKGDKVRSYNLLRHLLAKHRVHVGTFVDDPADEPHVASLRALCAGVCAVPLNPRWARVKSLSGLLNGQPLTLAYYRDPQLAAWVRQTCQSERIDAVVVFSSGMSPYAQDLPGQPPVVLDMVDVDSAKWAEYAPKHRWPLSILYRREARRLLQHESSAAEQAHSCFLATDNEVALFRKLAPGCGGTVQPMRNGVDADYFSADPGRARPYADDEQAIVFTGAMDYLPNVEAVCWFAAHVLPALRQSWPRVRFHIVGRNPAAEVRALAGDAVSVSGTVPDVRPYLQHAAAVVAPLMLGARHPEQGARGHGHGAPGGGQRELRLDDRRRARPRNRAGHRCPGLRARSRRPAGRPCACRGPGRGWTCAGRGRLRLGGQPRAHG